uniref:2-oxoacid dehydrogenase acyltransferase catalytic domain-containing protein n=1 Tax=Physcomitrium patens TaxID=3218 RepID=A0A2K1JDJ1_PHYPA|nr:hypothetical protein PHYPA_019875 [Physcomitrium patens]
MIPIVKKGLATIANDVKTLANKTRSNTRKSNDYEVCGTFMIFNLGGPFGIKQFCAIINSPQGAILDVGTSSIYGGLIFCCRNKTTTERQLVPGLLPDQYDISTFVIVTLSCDHHVIDVQFTKLNYT